MAASKPMAARTSRRACHRLLL